MPPSDLQRAVLDLVNQTNYLPMKAKAIAKQLGLGQGAAQDLKRVIKQLVKRGRLAYGPSHYVLPVKTGAASQVEVPELAADEAVLGDDRVAQAGATQHAAPRSSDRVVGDFRRVAAGYGFVRPSATPHSLGRKLDIYIAAKNAGDAATGDTVLVRLMGRQRAGKPGPEGEIVEIVERETNQFVGVYYEQGGQGVVQIDGKLFTQPISVGDPGAKGARPNDKVVLEMVRFPSHVHDGEGVIVKVLGPRGEPGVDTLSIMHEFNLPGDFAPDAMDYARRAAEAFDESIGPDRHDFTADTIITIDPVDARDFDDAVSLVQTERGHWLLGVHIADVSHFVQPKTALDREATDRATSVYLPDKVIPMLPEVISNNLASLQPDRVRYTVSAVIEFTADGTRVDCALHKGAIKSCRRFTYEEVDEFLADREAWKAKLTPGVYRLLGDMHTLAMMLRGRRMRRGSLELSMPEVKIDLDRDGRVAGAHLVANTESHQIIEEFMLAANEAVADTLKNAGLSFMRRIHEAPDPRKLQALNEFVHELGFQTDSLESRFAIQALLDAVKGMPQEHAVNYATLRSMQKAIYSPEEEGHYALASECYCHFTSPIRRYPDLTIHRLVEALLAKRPPLQDIDALYAAAEHCSNREQRAVQAERELTKSKLLDYLSQRIGEELDGVITGVEDYGLYVQGVQLPAEGLVHVSSLQDDYYRFDRKTHTLSGNRSGNSFRLGDPVRVAVARVDIDRRELDFRLVGRLKSLPPRTITVASSPREKAKGDGQPRRSRPKPRSAPPKKGARRKRQRDE